MGYISLILFHIALCSGAGALEFGGKENLPAAFRADLSDSFTSAVASGTDFASASMSGAPFSVTGIASLFSLFGRQYHSSHGRSCLPVDADAGI
jgi:hypothetical protein